MRIHDQITNAESEIENNNRQHATRIVQIPVAVVLLICWWISISEIIYERMSVNETN